MSSPQENLDQQENMMEIFDSPLIPVNSPEAKTERHILYI